MKRGIVAATIITFLIVTSTLALTLPLMPKAQLVKARSEPNPIGTDVTPSSAMNAVDPQISALQSTEQSIEAGVLSVEQNERILTHDQLTSGIQTDQNQTAQPPVPFPDGRIFLGATSGADDAIPYIPTEYTKPTIPPIVPSELDV